jgi:hypothetical protein
MKALANAQWHSNIPTECSVCGAADFSSVVEVSLGPFKVLHWASPPSGWFLLREGRLPRGVPLIHARCAACMASVLKALGDGLAD